MFRGIKQPTRPKTELALYTVVGLTILAPTLGGSTELWAQAILAIGSGLLFLVHPPKRSLGRLANCLFIALLAISITGFLPASLFSVPQWRTDLSQLGANLAQMHSPQPRLTLQWTGFLFLALVWSYYVVELSSGRRLRKRLCVIFALAVLCLSATLIVAFVTKQRVPFWPQTERFGFFPNRNQTSNVLSLGGIMIYALGLQAFQENRKQWWWWLVSLCIVCWALIINYSLAGIVLFFFGALALHLYWWRTAKDRRRPIVAIGGLLLLVALFIINGGATLTRFSHETPGLLSESGNLRWLIYKDAFHLLGKSPLFGIGLGNFRSIFAFNRLYSASESEAAHPESDWLWSAIDLGVIAPLIVLVLVCWWIKKCLPFDPGSIRLLRAAALICGCAFLVHGIFDVSGHRIGALWPALFLGSVAVHPQSEFKISPWIVPAFRVFGLVLVLIGLWWMSSFFGGAGLATTATQDEIRNEITSAIDREDYLAVPALADAGLQVAPLDWLLYYKRGLAEVALNIPHRLALRDFTISNYLNPLWPDLYFHQGEVWLSAGEIDLATTAWKETVQRGRDRAAGFYERMLGSSKDDPDLFERLRPLADENNRLLLIYIRYAGPFEFQNETERLISENRQIESFSQTELSQFFSEWYKKGNKLELATILEEHPNWKKAGWRVLARIYADYQDYRKAWETAEQFGTKPELPAVSSGGSLEDLGARFQLDRANLPDGLALYFAQLKKGQADAARATLSQLIAQPGAPDYLWYLEDQTWATKGDWQKAWNARARFEFKGNNP